MDQRQAVCSCVVMHMSILASDCIHPSVSQLEQHFYQAASMLGTLYASMLNCIRH